jgi:amidase
MGLEEETAWMDATDQAALVRSGAVTALEMVDAAIARIESVNPKINAVIHERFDRARTEAAGDLPAGPLRGVPFLLKDLGAPSAGDPHHFGAGFLKKAGHRADHDSYLTARFRAAGLIFVGRTNVPEFGSTITTEPLAYGPTRNPWNLDHSTGGSSGGSAAAVAAGCTAAAHANDGGGSIRSPASECCLVGLKPSRGRVSLGPDLGEAWMGATIDHAVTRTVRDCATILDCIAGYEPGDPYTAPTPSDSFLSFVGRAPGSLRVGLLDHSALDGFSVDPECCEAVVAAGALLAGLGHRVEQSHPGALGEAEFQGRFVEIVAASGAEDLQYWSGVLGRTIDDDELEPGNALFAQMGRVIPATRYLDDVRWMHAYTRRMAAWWADHDLLVTPVIATPPPPIGWLSDETEGLQRVIQLIQFTPQFNITGQPAVSLPLHHSASGLPVGVQLVAAYGREDLLLSLAAQLEEAAPWASLRPPVHG